MMDIPHIGFIVAAYVIAAAAIGTMIAAIWLDYRALSAELTALERRSGRRGEA